jgi:hypothetical protein
MCLGRESARGRFWKCGATHTAAQRWHLETEGVHQLEREFLSSLDMALDSGSFRGGTSELSILESSLRSLAIFGPKYIAEI